jgi:hypothetical protein
MQKYVPKEIISRAIVGWYSYFENDFRLMTFIYAKLAMYTALMFCNYDAILSNLICVYEQISVCQTCAETCLQNDHEVTNLSDACNIIDQVASRANAERRGMIGRG